MKKKYPATGECSYRSSENPIADRWERDGRFKHSCNKESQKEFGINFTRKMAYDADEIARHEKELGTMRAVENA